MSTVKDDSQGNTEFENQTHLLPQQISSQSEANCEIEKAL